MNWAQQALGIPQGVPLEPAPETDEGQLEYEKNKDQADDVRQDARVAEIGDIEEGIGIPARGRAMQRW